MFDPTVKLSDWQGYHDRVMDYAEYLGVPEYVLAYEPADVAQSYGPAITTCFCYKISPRMTAIMLFSLTIHKIMAEKRITH